MAVRETTAISSNCCSCRSLTVTFEICELRHSLEGWAASCSCVIGRFCHIPPLSSQLAAAGKSNALVWRVRPDPPLRGVGLRLAARPSRRASTGRLSRRALRSERVERRAPHRRVEGSIWKSTRYHQLLPATATNLRSSSFWAAALSPRARRRSAICTNTTGVQSQLSEGPNPSLSPVAEDQRHSDFLVAAASRTAARSRSSATARICSARSRRPIESLAMFRFVVIFSARGVTSDQSQ
jgi:hypothetical protein